MGDYNVKLASLIGSRICHDLISPIGAITNGLELMELSGTAQGPEMDLIGDSVASAGARIRFFRIAYGAAGEQMLGRTEVAAVLRDISRASRVEINWQPTDPHPRALVRLAFLALQCCETAMPYGGTVRIAEEAGTWTVKGAAEKLNVDTALWDGLTVPGGGAEVTPAQVQFALLPALAQDMGRSVAYGHDATGVTIGF